MCLLSGSLLMSSYSAAAQCGHYYCSSQARALHMTYAEYDNMNSKACDLLQQAQPAHSCIPCIRPTQGLCFWCFAIL